MAFGSIAWTPFGPVHNLCHAKIHRRACQQVRIVAGKAFHLDDPVEHLARRHLCRFVEIGVKADGHVVRRRFGSRPP
jgi:hypothetical protein